MHFMGFHKFLSFCTSAFIAWIWMAQMFCCSYTFLTIYNTWNSVYGNEFCRQKKLKFENNQKSDFFILILKIAS